MDMLAQLEKDKADLVDALEKMQGQFEEMGRRINQQVGAIRYVDLLLVRVKAEQNGTTPPVVDEPPAA